MAESTSSTVLRVATTSAGTRKIPAERAARRGRAYWRGDALPNYPLLIVEKDGLHFAIFDPSFTPLGSWATRPSRENTQTQTTRKKRKPRASRAFV